MVEVADPPARPRRQRNPRGRGSHLRDEIMAGAAALLERTGSEDSVTLRAVAREIGIAAPSISGHFADRAEIIDAVVAAELAALVDAIADALAASTEPVEALLAAWRTYLSFGQAHPNRYRVIFERRFLPLWDSEARPMTETAPVYAVAVEMMIVTLQACVDAGRSASTNALADSVAIWCALHGLVALPPAITSFPWPEIDTLLTEAVTRLARITDAPAGATRRTRTS